VLLYVILWPLFIIAAIVLFPITFMVLIARSNANLTPEQLVVRQRRLIGLYLLGRVGT
jgi:hypothetical protein